jgi:uncharacterized protein YijF (DUF1287 family)
MCKHWRSLLLIALFVCALADVPAQDGFTVRLSDAALQLTQNEVAYDPGYYAIEYPNGDVPGDRGVCSDVLVRAYRILGIDLQKEVHEDMLEHFSAYPQLWGLSGPDPNIDHRRVPNLMTFFTRQGSVKPITDHPEDYLPGDIVCWNLGGAVTHIGIVVERPSVKWEGWQVVHNIGAGQVVEDCLFDFRIIGHFLYTGQ